MRLRTHDPDPSRIDSLMPDHEGAPRAGLARRAETLLRALDGVLDARVSARRDGAIRDVQVVAAAGADRLGTARSVRSALLAGLAAAVDMDRIRVTESAAPQPPDGNGDGPGSAQKAEGAPNDAEPDRAGPGGDEQGYDDEYDDEPPGPRLVVVELEPRDGERLACTVAVVVDDDIRRATVETPDLPGAAEHAAAEAAVRAMRQGGLDLALDGVRRTDIAGHDYVVVALRTERKGDTRRRAAARVITRSGAGAAAAAAIDAARRIGA